MKRSDIPDWEAISLAWAWQQNPQQTLGVMDALVAHGFPVKVVHAKLKHLADRGLLEYGSTIRYSWPTEEGKAALSARADW